MRELDDQLSRRSRSGGGLADELAEVDPLDVEPADAAGAGDQLVSLAADAEAGGCGRSASTATSNASAQPSTSRPKASARVAPVRHDGSDRVREARRPGVLDRAFPETGLDELEVGDAR